MAPGEHENLPIPDDAPQDAGPGGGSEAPAPEPAQEDAPEPETLVQEFQGRSEVLDRRLDELQDMIRQIRNELHDENKQSLQRLARVAMDMAQGRVYQKIDIEAKGEVGALVQSLNQTLVNLQQLDASVKQQSTQVPELAAQLDAITTDTEHATQEVMNRLDTLMSSCEQACTAMDTMDAQYQRFHAQEKGLHEAIHAFLERAQKGESAPALAQEVIEFLFAQQMVQGPEAVDTATPRKLVQGINDEAFEILNILQFQDITRQKIEKVVLLLKQFQNGLQRLLAIFNIAPADNGTLDVSSRKIATQDRIFDAKLEADHSKDSVDDIIAQFKKDKG